MSDTSDKSSGVLSVVSEEFVLEVPVISTSPERLSFLESMCWSLILKVLEKGQGLPSRIFLNSSNVKLDQDFSDVIIISYFFY